VGVTQVTWTNSAGGSGTASGTTAWSATVSLQSGSNVLTATARDAAGNTVSASLTVTYIPSPPPPGSIAVSPASVALTTVAGQVPASQAVTVTVPNGGLFSTYDSATFYDSSTCYSGTGKSCPSGTVVPIVPITGNVQSLPPGTYSAPLTVSSSGYADVLVPVVLTVTATPPPPPPTDTTPPSDIQVTAVSKSNGMLTLSGTARDNVGVSKVTWTSNRGGSGMASGSATWSFTVPLKPGQTTFSITAWDAAGNNRTETITVKR
jgi:hypothetical protein